MTTQQDRAQRYAGPTPEGVDPQTWTDMVTDGAAAIAAAQGEPNNGTPEEYAAAAIRAALAGRYVDPDKTLPLPPGDRMAAYHPDHAGRGAVAVWRLEGWHAIFRFAVNLLTMQVDIAAAARPVLVQMREDMTPARFDPFALSMLGSHRYAKLRDRFERCWSCRGCERNIPVGGKYYPTDEGGAVCARCCAGHKPYTSQMVKRPPTAPSPVNSENPDDGYPPPNTKPVETVHLPDEDVPAG